MIASEWTEQFPELTIASCPFCGASKAPHAIVSGQGFGGVFAVHCRNCFAQGPAAAVKESPFFERGAPPELHRPYRSALREMAQGEAIRLWNALQGRCSA